MEGQIDGGPGRQMGERLRLRRYDLHPHRTIFPIVIIEQIVSETAATTGKVDRFRHVGSFVGLCLLGCVLTRVFVLTRPFVSFVVLDVRFPSGGAFFVYLLANAPELEKDDHRSGSKRAKLTITVTQSYYDALLLITQNAGKLLHFPLLSPRLPARALP